ncbi:MAG: hypothetical protein LBQ61_07620 [Spirochaetales bacterium]|jgi:hypothetical protein|nr:hypothetical protein [Spirochaetales bacterium]
MKKVLILLVMILAVSSVFGADIQLGQFPLGSWLDSNYNAVWEFTTNNIRILAPGGAVLYDFSTKTLENFRVFLDGTQPGISFSCVESGRSYRFLKPLTNTDVTLQIDRTARDRYTVSLKRQ